MSKQDLLRIAFGLAVAALWGYFSDLRNGQIGWFVGRLLFIPFFMYLMARIFKMAKQNIFNIKENKDTMRNSIRLIPRLGFAIFIGLVIIVAMGLFLRFQKLVDTVKELDERVYMYNEVLNTRLIWINGKADEEIEIMMRIDSLDTIIGTYTFYNLGKMESLPLGIAVFFDDFKDYGYSESLHIYCRTKDIGGKRFSVINPFKNIPTVSSFSDHWKLDTSEIEIMRAYRSPEYQTCSIGKREYVKPEVAIYVRKKR